MSLIPYQFNQSSSHREWWISNQIEKRYSALNDKAKKLPTPAFFEPSSPADLTNQLTNAVLAKVGAAIDHRKSIEHTIATPCADSTPEREADLKVQLAAAKAGEQNALAAALTQLTTLTGLMRLATRVYDSPSSVRKVVEQLPARVDKRLEERLVSEAHWVIDWSEID